MAEATSTKSEKQKTVGEIGKSAPEMAPQTAVSGIQAHVLNLQRKIGNRAVSRLLQSHMASPRANSAALCSMRRAATVIQPKLEISHPHDKYEQEADGVAERVMHMPEP